MSNTERIAGKVAVVTGGTRGIGRAVVEALLDEGMKVAFCGASQLSVDSALKAIGRRPELWGAKADVSVCDEARMFVQAAADRFGGVDVLVNNAGLGVFRAVSELEPREWDRMISLNLSGAYYCSHAVLPIFRQRGGGDIVNMSSLAGRNPFEGGSGYNASKFGLNGFSEAMMLDHRHEGVRVSYIMPGSVATEFGGGASGSGAEWKIAPEDVARVVTGLLRMPRRTTVSRVEIRPSQPAKARKH